MKKFILQTKDRLTGEQIEQVTNAINSFLEDENRTFLLVCGDVQLIEVDDATIEFSVKELK